MEELTGFIEHIVFTQPENGFTVARLQPPEQDLIHIIGYMPGLQPGETLTCQGEWKQHPKFGRQFEVKEHHIQQPCDVHGIQKYLESGLIKGIGPVYAQKIIETFGLDTLEVIDQTPFRLLEIEGIGKKRVEMIIDCWQEQRSIRDVMIFLRGHGVTPAYAQKIFKIYGDQSIAKVKENPYQLAKDIFGIGFKMADTIAQNLGFTGDSPKRVAAGIEHVLWELSNEGHTCYPLEEFLPIAINMLGVEEEPIRKILDELIAKEFIYCGKIDDLLFIWLRTLYSFEQGIGQEIQRIAKSLLSFRSIATEKAIEWVEEQMHIAFAEEQKEAIRQCVSEKMHIITGGPGTGKSTITKAILTISEKITDKITLAAPTGRAAKRLQQITAKHAYTIHGLLEYDFSNGGFKRNSNNPLTCELIIIDEASMIDTHLMYHLLLAIPDTARVLFIGDVDQLPSVGPGSVLKDLIEARTIGVTRLQEIFRQAKGSTIIVNAHKINHGEFPILSREPWSDFHYYEENTPEEIQARILELLQKEIPSKGYFNPIDDVQVLSPMRRGVVGIEILNHVLQQALNPSNVPFFRGGKRFHLHDKVMQIRNNYDKKVYNGDVGKILDINLEEQLMMIRFDGKEVEYDFADLEEVVLAYAVSIHKYQGSECPCVIIPIHTSHFKLLHRNLLYTGVTRGKRRVILVGMKKAIAIAVKNDQILKRYTGLKNAVKTSSYTKQGVLKF